MSPAMVNLQRYLAGKVDLYYNDMWGLKTTLRALIKIG